ncbi:MAG: DUF4911 domain-containing protein [Bdellovibrionales bacterium]|nr:DUF4911 domain-containing protein [Bdellovibrionales bacterium]
MVDTKNRPHESCHKEAACSPLHEAVPEQAIFQDVESAVVFLDVARKDIVFFQALFESYEGIGTVRTMDSDRGIISILSTPSSLGAVLEVLNSFKNPQMDKSGAKIENRDGEGAISWRFASHLHPAEKSRYVDML